ncbi:hypothetical protein LNO75_00270 [Mycoplasma sp. T363T]|uniref:Uncharacterized protein n=1 Tax=Mycoplasma bradburyae TaxID=2963128 RepID=A0AAW6HMZ9_9MOLU|nr:hypothetical protein [Mycoplasma bradburyae]MDC4163015.1 hypothetical protein [Mycoplasma bradburyae]MDC4182353.1 hypothetical protein [Mycoplasma bradburyae]MDC4183079.1 hypothetical protein [Mycoplasma bradburyae]UTS70685.1 hypothetical protein NMG77_02935 [Mycoplasma bradburyae]
MSIELNSTIDKIKYKLNTILNSEKFETELKNNEAFRAVLFKQIAIYKFLASKTENASDNLEYVEFALNKLNKFTTSKYTSDKLVSYDSFDDANDDINYLDIFILNTFNKSFDEIIDKPKVNEKEKNVVESNDEEINNNKNDINSSPTVSDIEDEEELNKKTSFSVPLGSSIDLKENLEKIISSISQPDYKQFASIVVKSESDIGKFFLFKEKSKLMIILNYLASVICLIFAAFGLGLLAWYFVLYQNQEIPTFVSAIDNKNYPILSPINTTSTLLLVAVNIICAYTYITSAIGKTSLKKSQNAIALISTYTNKEVKPPHINDNLRYSFRIKPLIYLLLFIVFYSFSPFFSPYSGGSLLDGIKHLYSVPSKIFFSKEAVVIPADTVYEVTKIIWIGLISIPLAIIFLIVISMFFKPKIDKEKIDEAVDKYAEEIKKAANEITSIFERNNSSDSSNKVF